ncbi:uncharacterized protein LOC117340160 [Pecten maximus]|uniref:uncharacterized protein LOC117340160 n=1 Tax=Pecten maximus TaxID=6579 RepID=UPI001458E8D0|nr:uncharacterized protein LOC117340160 [Pecten maximus]
MNKFQLYICQFVIQLLTNVNCGELMSNFLNTTTNLRCASPFRRWSTIGYIQCQKTCIRYSDCGVLRYKKSSLECYLFTSGNCLECQVDDEQNIYLRRTAISEAIGGSCHSFGCSTSNVCVLMKNSVRKCLTQTVSYVDASPTFIDMDGVIFWVYPVHMDYFGAKEFCETFPGRLAILNTNAKKNALYYEARKHDESGLWYVGATRNENGDFLWGDGEAAHVDFEDEDGNCVVLYGTGLHDIGCRYKRNLICEAI